jgi:hypothetical protein
MQRRSRSSKHRPNLQRLARTSLEHRFAIIEDDYDHEFHYEGKPVLPIASGTARTAATCAATAMAHPAPASRERSNGHFALIITVVLRPDAAIGGRLAARPPRRSRYKAWVHRSLVAGAASAKATTSILRSPGIPAKHSMRG